MTRKKPPAPPPADPPRGPVHLYFLTTSGEVRSLERYRWRNGEWRSALTGIKAPAHFTISKWEPETRDEKGQA